MLWDINGFKEVLKIGTDDDNFAEPKIDIVHGITGRFNNIHNAHQGSLHSLHALARRPQPLLPRFEGQVRADSRIVQQHAPTEVVSALAFLPGSTHLLITSISQRWLRLFDLRMSSANSNMANSGMGIGTGGHTNSWAAGMGPGTTSGLSANVPAKVQGIATDPYEMNRIACFGDGTVTVWDARKMGAPFLTFSEKDALADGGWVKSSLGSTSVGNSGNNHGRGGSGGVSGNLGSVGGNSSATPGYTTIEFSSTRRSCVATLEKDSGYVRFWDIRESRVRQEGAAPAGNDRMSDGGDSSSTARTAKRSWTSTLSWQAGSAPPTVGHNQERGHVTSRTRHDEDDTDAEQLFYVLADTRRSKLNIIYYILSQLMLLVIL